MLPFLVMLEEILELQNRHAMNSSMAVTTVAPEVVGDPLHRGDGGDSH